MTADRPTVRPVTLPRLVELVDACSEPRTTEDVESTLDVTHRRARETILEGKRINLIGDADSGGDSDTDGYERTQVGASFLRAVRDEAWQDVSDILETWSPHYGAFVEVVEQRGPTDPDRLLEELRTHEEFASYTFNQTGIELVSDWGQRLGRVHRNAFSGTYYPVTRTDVPDNFPYVVLTAFDDLESSAGVDLRQRYLPIPELRETVCERLTCTREAFDAALVDLVGQNVGRLELSGAPIDTGAKDAQYGIKEIALADGDGLVSTAQSTDRVMAGVEQFDKRYYYLAVHDRDLQYTPTAEP